ncbi:MAG: hypothetical protein ACLQFR_11515 [Streptosporangiaceae bacterium]
MSATLTEHLSGATPVNIIAQVTEQHNPLIASMSINETVGATNIRIRGILTTDTMYMKFNGTSFGMPAAVAHKWIKIPLNEPGTSSAFAQLMHGVQNTNPIQQAELLLAADHLHPAGTQTVGGVSTRKYVGWTTPAAAFKRETPSVRAALAPALRLMTGRIGITVWIDGQMRIRKLIYIEHVASNQLTVVCTYHGFNRPVHITLPSASQVVTLPASALSGAA